MPVQRYKLTIAYDGTEFHGWQRQVPPVGPELRTVQGVVAEAIVHTVKQPVMVQGASRTDSGVHAMGQVAHFDAETRIPIERLADAINARLPADVEVRQACVVPPTFDAISDAVEKQYRYTIWNDRRRPLGERYRVYYCWRVLDVGAMRAAAALLVGEHDFAGFAAAGHGRESTIRTVFGCEVQPLAAEVHILVRGNGFLYNMVRIIAGTLVAVGRGRFGPERVAAALAEGRRVLAGPTLPPQGLCLEWIRYRGDAPATPAV